MHKVLYTFFLLFSLFSLSALAQELEVKSFGASNKSLKARVESRVDNNGNPCAVLHIQIPFKEASFENGYIVGDVEKGVSEYTLYMADGARNITIRVPGYLPLTITFREHDQENAALKGKTDYVLVVVPASGSAAPRSKSSTFYLEAGALAGGVMGGELSLGACFSGFNLEANAMMPFGSSEQLWWNHPSQESEYYQYKPAFSMAGRVGYVIRIGEKFRLTPQVGMRFLKTSEKAVESRSLSEHASGSNVSSLLLALKLQFMFSKHIGLCLAPEYDMALMKSEGFKALSSTSSKINKWNNGIGAKLALHIAF